MLGVATALAGCGVDPAEPNPAAVESGTVIAPQQYLADSSAAAESVSDFMAEIESLGTEPSPAALRRAAPGLSVPLATTTQYSRRLSSARLDDARLEAQRVEAATALESLVEAMEQFTGFAAQGDRLRASVLTNRLADRAEALRRAAGDS